MPHPFFDLPSYPWHLNDAAVLHRSLHQAIRDVDRIDNLYRQCLADPPPLNLKVPPDSVWTQVLNNLSVALKLRRLCDLIVADQQLQGIHPAALAVRHARDPLVEPVLSEDTIFVNRKALREVLARFSTGSSSRRVLLVRGECESGKSWTATLVRHLADRLGMQCIYLFEGLVFTVEDVAEQLFTLLGDPSAMPPRLETSDAWFRKCCLRLQDLAQRKSVVTWVIVDDLGDYPEGSRLDLEIRRFFDQCVLAMANPAFARWFRLVLLDYPQGEVPTKWKSEVWVEDRPSPQDLTVAPIAEFLQQWAESRDKQLTLQEATSLASSIVDKVDAPAPDDGPSGSRLKRIHDELATALSAL
jgi:hypothetical protein